MTPIPSAAGSAVRLPRNKKKPGDERPKGSTVPIERDPQRFDNNASRKCFA